MGVYATEAQITAALAAHPELGLPGGEALDALILAGERAVDARLGPLLRDPVTGAKLAPLLLNAAQRAALVRAVAVAVGHLSQLDDEAAFGLDDYLPNLLSLQRGDGLAARIDSELAGFGLLARSHCALPDPPPARSGVVLLAGDLPLA